MEGVPREVSLRATSHRLDPQMAADGCERRKTAGGTKSHDENQLATPSKQTQTAERGFTDSLPPSQSSVSFPRTSASKGFCKWDKELRFAGCSSIAGVSAIAAVRPVLAE